MNKTSVPVDLKRSRHCWDEWRPSKKRALNTTSSAEQQAKVGVSTRKGECLQQAKVAYIHCPRSSNRTVDRRRWRAKAWQEHFSWLSKKLSKVLRHTAVEEGFDMRKDGCIAVHDLLAHWSFKAFTEEGILVCIQNIPRDRSSS